MYASTIRFFMFDLCLDFCYDGSPLKRKEGLGMNKQRRSKVDAVIDKLRDIQEEINDILSEEEEYRDNIPENLQGSERYENADNNCSNLQSAADQVDEVISYLEESQA